MSRNQQIDVMLLFNNFKKTFFYLIKKWLTIAIFSFVCGLLGLTYAWLQKPKYTAELVFSSETNSENGLGGYAGIAAQFGFDLGGGAGSAFEGDNLIELLRSSKIVHQTLLSPAVELNTEKLMIDVYITNHELNKNWQKDSTLRKVVFEIHPAKPNRIRDSILKAVYKGIVEGQLKIDKIDKKLNYVSVKMTDNNELYAKVFVEELVKNATNYYIDYKSKKARKNFQVINRLTDSVRGMLYGNIEDYASANDLNVNPLRQIVRTGSQKIQINAQANTALYSELLKQLGLAQITLQKETPLIQIIDEPLLPLLKKKPGRLLTGIIFSVLGFVIIVSFLLTKQWVSNGFELNENG